MSSGPPQFQLSDIPIRGLRALGRLTGLTQGQTRAYHTFLFLVITAAFFGYICLHMGVQNSINTLIRTAYYLLINTVFLTMSMTTLAGAFGRLLSEFGFTNLFNIVFRYFMRPLYGMPGITFLGAFSAFLSENMTIVPFARDPQFMRHIAPKHVPMLCNLGTSYGMGLFIVTLLIGGGYYKEAMIGLVGAFVGSIFSVRMMALWVNRIAKGDFEPDTQRRRDEIHEMEKMEKRRLHEERSPDLGDFVTVKESRGFLERFMTAVVEGGRYGVDIGLGMIPGVLVICSCLMILLMPAPVGGFSGNELEGVALIPRLMEHLKPVLHPLLGMESAGSLGMTMVCLGSAAAAASQLPQLKEAGIILSSQEVSVFAAFAILWSGFLSTHVAVMDALGFRRFISAALWTHLVAGLVAGITANFLFQFLVAAGWI